MNVFRSTAVISGFTMVSRLLGFARDLVLARTLGAGPVADAFYTALVFPNLFRRVFAEGAFSQAFVPVFSRTLERDGIEEASEVGAQTFSGLFAVTAGLTILAQILMPAIMLVFQGGYAMRGDWDTFWLSVFLTQITMPYLTAMSLAALFQGVLNTHSRFALAAAAPTLLNLCLLTAALSFREPPIAVAYACSVAIFVAGVLQASLLFWGCRRLKVRLRLMRPRLTPAVKRIVAIAVPGALAASAVQINITVSQALSSFEEGAKSWLNYADRLYQLPLGLIGVAVGVAVLPALSRAAEADDRATSGQTMDQALGLALGLTLPAVAALLAIPTLLIDSLFAGGEFTSADAAMSGLALFHYAWGVPAFVLVKVLAPVFYARHDTVRPMRYAIASVVVNIAVGAGLFFWLSSTGRPGFPGLAVGTSLASWVNVALLVATLLREGWYRPGPVLLKRLAGALIACALMAAALLYCAANFGAIEGATGSKFLAVLLVAGAGGAIYGLAALPLGVVRPSDLRALVSRRRAAAPPEG